MVARSAGGGGRRRSVCHAEIDGLDLTLTFLRSKSERARRFERTLGLPAPRRLRLSRTAAGPNRITLRGSAAHRVERMQGPLNEIATISTPTLVRSEVSVSGSIDLRTLRVRLRRQSLRRGADRGRPRREYVVRVRSIGIYWGVSALGSDP